jgi:hypothetical protein
MIIFNFHFLGKKLIFGRFGDFFSKKLIVKISDKTFSLLVAMQIPLP